MKTFILLAQLFSFTMLGAMIQRDFLSDDSITWKNNFEKCIAGWSKTNKEIMDAVK